MTPRKPSGTSKSKAKSTSPSPSTPASGGGFQVQIFYRAASSTVPKAPIKDALWFATYPIIPRIGDCLFHDGIFYRVERIFLYENTAPGWCADVEVSFYGRR